MRHTLGTVTFSVPDEWRDDSTYVFMAPDNGGTILVEIPTTKDPQDAASLLAAAVANHRAVYESLVIYVNRLPSKPAVGMSVAAVEGEQEGMDGGGTRTRFAIAALESGRQRALLTFMSSSRADSLKLVRRVLESVTFADAAGPCIAGVGMKRAQANFVHLDVPADWRSPDTLSFLHRDSDRVALRVTIGEPVVPEGALDFSKETPGRVHVLARTTEPANKLVPGARGWDGEWLVECGAPPARVILRKAVWEGGARQSATMYGQAPEPLGPLLDPGWKSLRSTVHSFGGR